MVTLKRALTSRLLKYFLKSQNFDIVFPRVKITFFQYIQTACRCRLICSRNGGLGQIATLPHTLQCTNISCPAFKRPFEFIFKLMRGFSMTALTRETLLQQHFPGKNFIVEGYSAISEGWHCDAGIVTFWQIHATHVLTASSKFL